MTPLSQEWNKLTQPFRDIQSRPMHVELAKIHLSKMHQKIECHIYKTLQPESAYHCMNLLRGLAFSFLSQALSPSYRAAVSSSLACYVWIKAPQLKDRSSIKLLNSIATAFFLNSVIDFSRQDSLSSSMFQIPLDLAFSAAYFNLASRVEELAKPSCP